MNPQHVSTLTACVIILSQKRKVELAFSASRCSQCRNCWIYGHATQRCPAAHPTYPICVLHHTCAAHRCQNLTCPQSGNNKPVPSCGPTWPPMDVAVDGEQAPSTPPGRPGPKQMDLITPREPPPAGPQCPGFTEGFGGPFPLGAPSPSPVPSARRVRPGNE